MNNMGQGPLASHTLLDIGGTELEGAIPIQHIDKGKTKGIGVARNPNDPQVQSMSLVHLQQNAYQQGAYKP